MPPQTRSDRREPAHTAFRLEETRQEQNARSASSDRIAWLVHTRVGLQQRLIAATLDDEEPAAMKGRLFGSLDRATGCRYRFEPSEQFI